MKGVTAVPMLAVHSAMTPIAVERSKLVCEEANFMIGFWKIFQSSANWSPRALERPITTSKAVSITSQSYSDDSSSWGASSSPKSCWQGWDLVMIEASIDVVRSANLS